MGQPCGICKRRADSGRQVICLPGVWADKDARVRVY